MSSFGEILHKEREKQGYSIEEVHKLTLISLRNIVLIEEENWEELPADVYVKGYIKRYAKLLGLDGEAIWELALSMRDRPAEPEAKILSLPQRRDSGDVRLIQPQESLPAESEEDKDAADLQSNLKVIATHLLYESGEDSAAALRIGGAETADQAKQDNLPTEYSPTTQYSASQGEVIAFPSGKREKAAAATGAPAADLPLVTPIRLVRSDITEERGELDPDLRRRQKAAMQRRKQLQVLRQRALLTLVFWIAMLSVLVYILFFYDGGRLATLVAEWFYALFSRGE